MCCFIFQATPVGLGAREAAEVFPIVQLLVQMFVTGPGLLHHTHGQPVLVQVVVKGHGEHDGHALGANAAPHVEEVVGQQADGTRGRVVVLREGADFCLLGSNGGLRRVVAEATGHVDPAKKTSTWMIITADEI